MRRMPARNVIRPTLSGRFSNTPASNPATIAAAQLNQGAPNATAQTGSGPVAATRSTPQGFQGTGYVSTVQIPQSRNVTFTAPNGAKGIIQLSSNGRAKITSNPQYTEPIKQNGKVIGTGTFNTAIVNGKLASQIIGFKGNTLTEPVNSTANTSIGTLTEKGTINYQYALQGSELVPEITSTTGGIFYQSPHMQAEETEAQQAYSSSRSNLLFGSRVGLSNKSVLSQKQSQKQTQKNAYRNPPPTITPPPIPDYLYGAFAPDQRIKPPKPKAQKAAPPQKGTFKYINDLTSAMFNIHGSKKNKVYGSLGFFRPS